jgi:hypothetical protein
VESAMFEIHGYKNGNYLVAACVISSDENVTASWALN